MSVGSLRKLSAKICCFWTVVLEKALESPLGCKDIKPVNLKGNQPWIFIGRTDAEVEVPIQATWYEELTPWKKPWCWGRFRARGEEGNRGWDGWMASLTQRIWVWASSGRWWRTIWCAAVHGVSKFWTQLSNWTITTRGVVVLRSTGLQGPCLLNLKTEERTWSQ